MYVKLNLQTISCKVKRNISLWTRLSYPINVCTATVEHGIQSYCLGWFSVKTLLKNNDTKHWEPPKIKYSNSWAEINKLSETVPCTDLILNNSFTIRAIFRNLWSIYHIFKNYSHLHPTSLSLDLIDIWRLWCRKQIWDKDIGYSIYIDNDDHVCASNTQIMPRNS